MQVPTLTTEALILKRKNFGEADKILTVLTDRLGKISVNARGVRKITSRRAGNVELLNRVKLHLFKAKSYTLQEAESIETFAVLKKNLTLTTVAFHIIELLDKLIPEEQPNPMVYKLSIETLQTLQENPRQIILRSFEVKLLSYLGFWSTGSIKNLDPDVFEILNRLEKMQIAQILEIELNQNQAVALERVLGYYIENIIESNLKSLKVLRNLKNG